jgi:class 3 adenylate cyclase
VTRDAEATFLFADMAGFTALTWDEQALQVEEFSIAVRAELPHVEGEYDYFGATINLAARVSALAAGGELLVTGQTRA